MLEVNIPHQILLGVLGRRLKIRWGRPQTQNTQEEKKRTEPVAGLPNRKYFAVLFSELTKPWNLVQISSVDIFVFPYLYFVFYFSFLLITQLRRK